MHVSPLQFLGSTEEKKYHPLTAFGDLVCTIQHEPYLSMKLAFLLICTITNMPDVANTGGSFGVSQVALDWNRHLASFGIMQAKGQGTSSWRRLDGPGG